MNLDKLDKKIFKNFSDEEKNYEENNFNILLKELHKYRKLKINEHNYKINLKENNNSMNGKNKKIFFSKNKALNIDSTNRE